MKLNLDISVEKDDLSETLREGLSREELIKLILSLDEGVAEVNFTLELLESLIKSLKSDLNEAEIYEELKGIMEKL